MDGRFRLGNWVVDPESLTLSSGGELKRLEAKTMSVLCHLADRAPHTVALEELMHSVWGDVVVVDNVVHRAIALLRKALGDDSHSIIETVPRRGYRLTVAVQHFDAEAAAEPGATDTASTVSMLRRTGVRVFAMSTLAIGVLFALWQPARDLEMPADSAVIDSRSVAVLPFANLSGDPDLDHLAAGYVEDITNALASTAVPRVASRSSASRFLPGSFSLRDAARQLGVAYVVEGGIRSTGDGVRVTARLIRVADGADVWSGSYDWGYPLDALRLGNPIEVAAAVRNSVHHDAEDQEWRASGLTSNDVAMYYVLRGRERYRDLISGRSGAWSLVSGDYAQSVQNDSELWLANLLLMNAEKSRVGFDLAAEEGVRRAREALVRTRASAAMDHWVTNTLTQEVQLLLHLELDYQAAETALDCAIELGGPDSLWLLYFDAQLHVAQGRRQAALDRLHAAMQLDTYYSELGLFLLGSGWWYFSLESYEQAAAVWLEAASILEGRRMRSRALRLAALAELSAGRKMSAEALVAKAWRLSGNVEAHLFAAIYATLGDTEKARSLVETYDARGGTWRESYFQRNFSYFDAVTTYLALGEDDLALDWLDHAVDGRDSLFLLPIRTLKLLDPLRGHARFSEIMAKVEAIETAAVKRSGDRAAHWHPVALRALETCTGQYL